MIRRRGRVGSSDAVTLSREEIKEIPGGVLAACSASRAARFGSDAGKNPCGWHGEDQETMRRDRRSEDCVLEPRRSHPAGVICGKAKEGAQRRVAVPR